MSDSKPQNDPSMDDILASIRKIISDDEARAAAGPGFGMPASAPPQRPMQPAPPRSAPQPQPTFTTPAAPSGDEDVLLLTDLVEEPPALRPATRPIEAATTGVEPLQAKRVVDEPQSPAPPTIAPIPSPAKPVVMDINEPQPPTAAPVRPAPPPPPPPQPARETVGMGASAAERPNRTVIDAEPILPQPVAATPTAVGGKSVEDLVREMLRPMLQDWMDKNLPGMVEKHLKSEVDRIPRR